MGLLGQVESLLVEIERLQGAELGLAGGDRRDGAQENRQLQAGRQPLPTGAGFELEKAADEPQDEKQSQTGGAGPEEKRGRLVVEDLVPVGAGGLSAL